MKKQYFAAEAERLYVVEQCTLEEIAGRFNGGVSVRTLSTWKEELEWQTKREKYLSQKTAFHEELYVLARKLAQSVNEDLTNGIKPDQGRLFTLAKIIPLIVKTKAYEDMVGEKEKTGQISEEVLQTIQREILGM